MKLRAKKLATETARRADTKGTSINVAEVSRVLKVAFDIIHESGGFAASTFFFHEFERREKAMKKKENASS